MVAAVATPARPQIAIVIPAFNEAGAIKDVLDKLHAEKLLGVAEILVIDDGSTDATAEVAEAAGARVLRHPVNRGYGASLKTGIRATEADYILTMDADGQHRIEDVLKLCEAVRADPRADCVIGQRTKFLHSRLWRMPGKWMITLLAKILTKKSIKDINSGLRIMRREVLCRYVHLCPPGFSFSTTITVALLARGYYVQHVPIEVERRVGKSTVSVGTGFQTIVLVLRLACLFNPLRVFLPLAMVAILGGIGWTIPYTIEGQGVTVAAMLMVVVGILLFAVGLVCDQVAQLRLERYE